MKALTGRQAVYNPIGNTVYYIAEGVTLNSKPYHVGALIIRIRFGGIFYHKGPPKPYSI